MCPRHTRALWTCSEFTERMGVLSSLDNASPALDRISVFRLCCAHTFL